MAGITDDLNAVKTLQQGLVNNKVTRFAYEQSAYDNNEVDGQTDYVYARANNIPANSLSVMQVNQTVVDKGFRARASSMPRMLLNHIFGRISYNLNKINDLFMSVINSLIASIGAINGLVPLDSNGRIPYQYLPEDAIELKGTWNASTNTPALADGTGTLGDTYIVSVAGRQDLGSGSIYFFVGDRVIYNGSIWQRFSSGDVKTVCEIPPDSTGNVNLALQTDLTKIFPADFLTLLFQPLIGKIWGHVDLAVNVTKVVYADGLFVAIATDTIYWSEDGYDWTQALTQANLVLVDVLYSSGTWEEDNEVIQGQWLAVSEIDTVFNSSNGKNWSIYRNGDERITCKPGLSYVRSGESVFVYPLWYVNRPLSSLVCIKNGTDYTSLTLAGMTIACMDMTSGGMILAGSGYNADSNLGGLWKITILPDSKIKVTSALTNSVFSVIFSERRHDPSSTKFLVAPIGQGLYEYVDDNTINQVSGVPATDTVYSIDYANGLYVCGTNSGIYWSEDGTNWTQATGTVTGKRINKVLFGASDIDSRWVAGSQSNGLFWSDDGKVWFPGNGESTSNFVTIAHGEGGWVAGGANGLAHSDSANVSDYFADGGTV